MSQTIELTVGMKIEAGRGEDREIGTVTAVSGNMVTIAWRQSACVTTQPVEALENLEVK